MRPLPTAMLALALTAVTAAAFSSDHLDTPSVVADPRTDIGDVYAWIGADGRQLNLAMTIVGHTFSPAADYVFHVDSGKRFGRTTAGVTTACRFPAPAVADCRVGDADRISGDPGAPAGLRGRRGKSRLFAGLRDDPFFNNVKGSRDAFDYAAGLLRNGVPRDAAGCPLFDAAQTAEIQRRWRHTQGGPARDFLAGWTPASIVVAVDLAVVNGAGPMLAVWGEVVVRGRRIDRAGRPMTANALLAPLEPDDVADRLKERWNAASPATGATFIADLEASLALYDGYDGQCGNQPLADRDGPPGRRYRALATLLADDRLWIDSRTANCTRLFGVELPGTSGPECGGRTPRYDSANAFRSFLAGGAIDDGVHGDALEHPATEFPFLAAPASEYPPKERP